MNNFSSALAGFNIELLDSALKLGAIRRIFPESAFPIAKRHEIHPKIEVLVASDKSEGFLRFWIIRVKHPNYQQIIFLRYRNRFVRTGSFFRHKRQQFFRYNLRVNFFVWDPEHFTFDLRNADIVYEPVGNKNRLNALPGQKSVFFNFFGNYLVEKPSFLYFL